MGGVKAQADESRSLPSPPGSYERRCVPSPPVSYERRCLLNPPVASAGPSPTSSQVCAPSLEACLQVRDSRNRSPKIPCAVGLKVYGIWAGVHCEWCPHQCLRLWLGKRNALWKMLAGQLGDRQGPLEPLLSRSLPQWLDSLTRSSTTPLGPSRRKLT